MMKSSGSCRSVVLAGMTALTMFVVGSGEAQAQGILCDFFPSLPFCDPVDPPDPPDPPIVDLSDIEDRLDALEQQIASLLNNSGDNDAAIAQLQTDVAELQQCKEDLDGQVADIVAFLGECEIAGLTECDDRCVNLDRDPENCGDCGVECAMNETCQDGSCELRVCPNVGDCQVAILQQDGSCEVMNVPDGSRCDDGLDCSINDRCQLGSCVGGGNPCGPGETCVEGSGDRPTCIADDGDDDDDTQQ